MAKTYHNHRLQTNLLHHEEETHNTDIAKLHRKDVGNNRDQYNQLSHIPDAIFLDNPKIVSEYDQEIPQSQTADNPVAQRGRAA